MDTHKNIEVVETATEHGHKAIITGLPKPCFAKVRWAGCLDVPDSCAGARGYVVTTQSTGGPGSRRHHWAPDYEQALAHGLKWANRKVKEIARNRG